MIPRIYTYTALYLILAAGCRMVSEEEHILAIPESDTFSLFIQADSLILAGDFDSAESVLLALLSGPDGQENRDDILWRLAGIFNGRGMTDRGIRLFEELEQSRVGDLTGWKVSMLDLARQPEEALVLIPDEKVLLKMWISRDTVDIVIPSILPAPEDICERYVRVCLAPEGTLTPEQITLAATDAAVLPSLMERVTGEMALRARSGGPWVDLVLKQLGSGNDAAFLEADRMAYLRAGDESYWIDMLTRGGSAAGVAAWRLLGMDRARYGESWSIIDALVEAGDTILAADLMESSENSVFRTGARMTLDHHANSSQAVLETCSAVDSLAPDTLKARAALFRARSLRTNRNNGQAYEAYLDFAIRYPWHSVAREAAYLAGKYYDSEQDWPRAATAYLTSLRASGTWDGDERAHWRGGFCLYMSGRGNIGDSLWQEGIRKWPSGYWRDEMLFWRARYANRTGCLAREMDLLEQVSIEHPWEFYGMLAAERLGRNSCIDLTPTSIELASDPATSLALDMFSRGFGVMAVEMLQNSDSGNPGKRAIALGLIGEHRGSISLLRKLDTQLREEGSSILPDSLLCWYFPSPYAELSESVTDTMQLSSDVVQGIMREESYFSRWVVSHAGASGLIQLMPGTAFDVARWNGLPQLSGEDFFYPLYSVLYGSLYINRQWRNYQGQPELFLAAYNAGPGNASRWVDMHGWEAEDPELYIEQITYRETRMYVKKVLRSIWIYERIRS